MHGSKCLYGLNIRWTSTVGPAPQCSNGIVPNGPLMDTQYMNLAPRLGISYSPTPTTVIRTGYGIFYTQDIGNAYFDMARNIAGRASITNSDTDQQDLRQFQSDLGQRCTGRQRRHSRKSRPHHREYANAPSHKTSYTQQFLLNIQQQVGQDWSFEVGYQGALSRHLYGFMNANQPTPYGYIGTGAATSVASRLPFYVGYSSGTTPAQYGIQYVHDQGTGNYNAFDVKATRRFSKGLNVIASYTWGKSLDDTSGIRNQGNDNLYPQDSECIPCEYGRSAFDVKNRIVASAHYELPIGPGKLLKTNKAVGEFVGGWQIGGIFTHQTGRVATPLLGVDNASIASPFGNFDRPNPTGTEPLPERQRQNAERLGE